MKNTFRTIVAVLLMSTALSACSRGTSAPQSAANDGGSRSEVGTIVVTYASSITAEDRALLDEVGAKSELTTAIEAALGRVAKFRSGSPRTLEVEVTEFRLRSGATVFMTGLLSGADSVDAQVTVREKGSIVRQLKAGDATAGNFGGYTSASRFKAMAEGLAKRLAKEL